MVIRSSSARVLEVSLAIDRPHLATERKHLAPELPSKTG